MKWILGGLLLITLVGTAAAETSTASNIRQRLASAASEACLAGCASNSTNCKRICPGVLGTPCLASCDSQYQTCTQSCQNK
jgi:hypothetical protein